MKTTRKEHYPVHAAGQLWTVASVTLTELPDGTQAIDQGELDGIHRAVANAVCGAEANLTGEELEFLCDVADARYIDVARYLDMDKSTVTAWRRRGLVPSRVVSLALKKWFWFRLFGESMGSVRLSLAEVRDDGAFLRDAARRAIRSQVTFDVELRRAP
jgi:hypothetical protein